MSELGMGISVGNATFVVFFCDGKFAFASSGHTVTHKFDWNMTSDTTENMRNIEEILSGF